MLQNNIKFTGQQQLPCFYGDNVKKTTTDIAIIGGGCAGLMCGCIAGRESKGLLNITIFERNSKTGRKLLATGNGRCNLSNKDVSLSSYFCKNSSELVNIKDYLTYEYTEKLFADLGLLIKTDSAGRAYPQSKNASSVLDVLRNCISKHNVEERTDEKILSIKKDGNVFIIKSEKAQYSAGCVILACGGSASPVFGSDGNGYALAKSFGHKIVRPFPSLAPLFVNEDLRQLKGVRCDCEISLQKDNNELARESGELQINENNISGICVFNLSRLVNYAYANGEKPPEIVIDFLPELPLSELKTFILKNAFSNPDTPLEEILTGVINKKLGAYIIKRAAKLSPIVKCRDVSKKELILICNEIKRFRLTSKCESDLKKAQVSGGGVKLNEIDFRNMSSKIVDGLYFAGELVDIDAPCGGYNLQWAWASASVAAKSAVLRCLNDKDK